MPMNYFSRFNSNHVEHLTGRTPFSALQFFLLIVALGVLMAPALWNGFPFIFTDSLAYLTSATDLVAPVDRPIFYGLYIRLTNLFMDLWAALFFQAALVIFLLIRLAKAVFPTLPGTIINLWIIAVGLLSGASWFVGQMSPDIFTACLFLTMMIWAFSYEKSSILNTVLLSSLIVLECCMHSGNILIGSIFFIGLLAVFIFQNKSMKCLKRFSIPVLISFIISVILIVASNITFHQGYTFNRWGKVIFLARILEDGPGLQYLNANCPQVNLRICDALPRLNQAANREQELNFTDDPELKNLVLNALLWDGGINEAGGLYEVNREAGSIIRGTVSEYPTQVAKAFLGNTLNQFKTFTVGNHFGSTKNLEAMNSFFQLHYPQMFESYSGSHQFLSQVRSVTNLVNPFYNKLIWISAILMGLVFVEVLLRFLGVRGSLKKVVLSSRDGAPLLLVFGLLIFLIFNALVTGAVSGVFDRYQARVIWLVPAIALLVILGLRSEKNAQ